MTQHHTFMEGLEKMHKYVKETDVERYDGKKLREIIDSFGGKLTKHWTEEIQTLLALKIYNVVELKKAFIVLDEEMRKGDKVSYLCEKE